MPRRRHNRHKINLVSLPPTGRVAQLFFSRQLLSFSAMIFFVTIADAIMSYVAPIAIEEHVSSTLMMGIVFSFSSMIGLVSDFVLAKLFRSQNHHFFLKMFFLSAVIFPMIFLFPNQNIVTLLLAMAVWGIYYEFNTFSKFQFVKDKMQISDHAISWGVLSTFSAIAYSFGPILASFMLAQSETSPFYLVLILLSIGFLIYYPQLYKNRHKQVAITEPSNNISTQGEFRVWGALLKKIWPIYLFYTMIVIIDACFWSIGALLSEQLKAQHPWGGFLLTIHMIPPLFISFLVPLVAKPLGKKRAAFISALIAGVFLTIAGITSNIPLFLLLIFSSSVASSISFPEIYAVFEDYIARLGPHKVDMIGLQGSASSLAYIIGPIFAGATATLIGNQMTFSVMGGLLILVSLIMLIIVPKKIKMPQQELMEIETK